MGGVAAVHADLGLEIQEILYIPVLVCITENKIKGALQNTDKIMGIAEASINIGSNASLFEILKGYPVAILVDLYGDYLAACFCSGPCKPDR